MTTAAAFLKPIEPFKCAEQGFAWSGQIPLARFSRLTADSIYPLDDYVIEMQLKLRLADFHQLSGQHIVWLDAQINGRVPLQCQRCLALVEIDVSQSLHLAILNDEQWVDSLDDEADFIVLGEEEGTWRGDMDTPAKMDLLRVIEDELLLSLPTSPKHEQCQHQHQPVEGEIAEKKDNPFEILTQLKGKLH